jgi:hypothetical protein
MPAKGRKITDPVKLAKAREHMKAMLAKRTALKQVGELRDDPLTEEQRIANGLRAKRVMDLRLRGMSYDQITEELAGRVEFDICRPKLDAKVAHAIVTKALGRTRKELNESAEDLRKLELSKLDRLEIKLSELLEQDGGTLITNESGSNASGGFSKTKSVQPGVGGVIDRLLAVSNRRAALLGLDSATKLDATVTGALSLDRIGEIMKRAKDAKARGGQGQPPTVPLAPPVTHTDEESPKA